MERLCGLSFILLPFLLFGWVYATPAIPRTMADQRDTGTGYRIHGAVALVFSWKESCHTVYQILRMVALSYPTPYLCLLSGFFFQKLLDTERLGLVDCLNFSDDNLHSNPVKDYVVLKISIVFGSLAVDHR